MLYPSFHALFTAVLGWLGAVFVYLLLEQVINRMLAADLAAGQSICFLMPLHFLAAATKREQAQDRQFAALTIGVGPQARAERITRHPGGRDDPEQERQIAIDAPHGLDLGGRGLEGTSKNSHGGPTGMPCRAIFER